MKSRIIIVFLFSIAFSVCVKAQSYTAYMRDTVVTTWKSDTLLANTGINAQVFNHGPGSLSVATVVRDTTAADSKGRTKFIVIPSGSDQVFNSAPSVFWFKSSSSSAIEVVRSNSTLQRTSFKSDIGTVNIAGGAVTANAGTGTFSSPDTAYIWHEFSVEDSLMRPNNATAYVAGYALNDSTTANPKVLVFTLPQSGWEGQITDLYVTSDSANMKILRMTLYRDSTNIPRKADGAAIPYTAGNLNRRLGFIDILISGSIASAAGVGQTNFAGVTFAALPSNKIYAVVEVLSAFTPKKLENYYFKIKGFIKRPLP